MAAKKKAEPLADPNDPQVKLSAASKIAAEAYEKFRKGQAALAPQQAAVDALSNEHKEARKAFEQLRRSRLEELVELHPDLVDVLLPEHDRYARPTRLCREDCVRCRFEQGEWQWDGKPFHFAVSFDGWNE